MHEIVKAVTGIKVANCSTCDNLGLDGDGYEYNGTWQICTEIDRFNNLKSFPFKKEMKCWEPNFWCSKFAAMIMAGETDEITELHREFYEALDAVTLPAAAEEPKEDS